MSGSSADHAHPPKTSHDRVRAISWRGSLAHTGQEADQSPRHCRAPHVPKGVHLGCRLAPMAPHFHLLQTARNCAMEVAIQRAVTPPHPTHVDGCGSCGGSDGASALSWLSHGSTPIEWLAVGHATAVGLDGVPAVLEQKTSIRCKYLCYRHMHGHAHPVRSDHSDRSPIVEPSRTSLSGSAEGPGEDVLARVGLPLADEERSRDPATFERSG